MRRSIIARFAVGPIAAAEGRRARKEPGFAGRQEMAAQVAIGRELCSFPGEEASPSSANRVTIGCQARFVCSARGDPRQSHALILNTIWQKLLD